MVEKICIGSLTCLPNVGYQKYTMIKNRCKKLSISLVEFYTMDREDIKINFPFIKSELLDYFIKERETIYANVEAEFNYMEAHNIKITSIEDDDYPQKLTKFLTNSAPPIIYTFGNYELVNKNSIGIIGSRYASNIGLDITNKIAHKSVFSDKVVVSGYAKGIDYKAHLSALENDGSTIFVLPYSIMKWNNSIFNHKSIEDSSHDYLIISEFLKNSPIKNKAMPMVRNRVIASLSDEVAVIEAGLNSGTLSTALKCLKLNINLLVVDYSKEKKNPDGNDLLIKKKIEENIENIKIIDYKDFFDYNNKKNNYYYFM